MPRAKPVDSHTTLGTGGRRLWAEVDGEYELTAAQRSLLLEACRTKDRLDKLNQVLSGESETWMEVMLPFREGEVDVLPVLIDKAESAAVAATNSLKQILATLGLTVPVDGVRKPTANKTPQGKARGAYQKGGKVSSIHRGQRKAG